MVGDLDANISKLKAQLRQARYPVHELDIQGLLRGRPGALLPVLHYIFVSYSAFFCKFVSEKGFELRAKSDLRFLEAVYRVVREHLSYSPVLSTSQFFTIGFAERKVLFCQDILDIARRMHEELLVQAEGPTAGSAPGRARRSPTRCQPHTSAAPPSRSMKQLQSAFPVGFGVDGAAACAAAKDADIQPQPLPSAALLGEDRLDSVLHDASQLTAAESIDGDGDITDDDVDDSYVTAADDDDKFCSFADYSWRRRPHGFDEELSDVPEGSVEDVCLTRPQTLPRPAPWDDGLSNVALDCNQTPNADPFGALRELLEDIRRRLESRFEALENRLDQHTENADARTALLEADVRILSAKLQEATRSPLVEVSAALSKESTPVSQSVSKPLSSHQSAPPVKFGMEWTELVARAKVAVVDTQMSQLESDCKLETAAALRSPALLPSPLESEVVEGHVVPTGPGCDGRRRHGEPNSAQGLSATTASVGHADHDTKILIDKLTSKFKDTQELLSRAHEKISRSALPSEGCSPSSQLMSGAKPTSPTAIAAHGLPSKFESSHSPPQFATLAGSDKVGGKWSELWNSNALSPVGSCQGQRSDEFIAVCQLSVGS